MVVSDPRLPKLMDYQTKPSLISVPYQLYIWLTGLIFLLCAIRKVREI